MTSALKIQAHEIRVQAAMLLQRAENLLNELKEVNEITIPQKQDNIYRNGSRTIRSIQ